MNAIYYSLVYLLCSVTASEWSVRPVDVRAVQNISISFSQGTAIGNVMNRVESFGGIPYGRPPTGRLRLKPPQRLTEPLGIFDATGPAAACPQIVSSPESEDYLLSLLGTVSGLPFIQKATGQTEDCLTITVARPEGTSADAKLPVLFWIFGGGFQVS